MKKIFVSILRFFHPCRYPADSGAAQLQAALLTAVLVGSAWGVGKIICWLGAL